MTIDPDENSLNEKLSELQEQNKTSVYVIKGKLQEKEEQIQALIKKQEQFEQVIQSFIDSGQLKPKIYEG